MPCSNTRPPSFGHAPSGSWPLKSGASSPSPEAWPKSNSRRSSSVRRITAAKGLPMRLRKPVRGPITRLVIELGDFVGRPFAARGDLPEREVALLALELAVVLLHHAAAFRAGRAHRRVDHVGDLAFLMTVTTLRTSSEICSMNSSRVSLPASISLSLCSHSPVSSGEASSTICKHMQREHQRERLRRRDELATVAVDVLLADQPLDGRRAGRRRAQAFGLHRLAQLVVFDQLARAFHRREQRRFRVARRRLGLRRLLARLPAPALSRSARSPPGSAPRRRPRGRRPRASPGFAARVPSVLK